MVNKKQIIEFFNNSAENWDSLQEQNPDVINIILDNAGISAGSRVLDVACGTGIMIPYYLERGAQSVTGIDISEKMLEKAREKFPQHNVSFMQMDAEKEVPSGRYDAVVIYNAFPHFPDPHALLKNLSSVLVPGGIITVAHGASRNTINNHHSEHAHEVSLGLVKAEELAGLFSEFTEVTTVIDNDSMYQLAGRKPEQKKPSVQNFVAL